MLVGDFGQVTSAPCVSDFLTSHIVVLSVADWYSFEKPLNKKIDWEELSEELPE